MAAPEGASATWRALARELNISISPAHMSVRGANHSAKGVTCGDRERMRTLAKSALSLILAGVESGGSQHVESRVKKQA